MSTMRTSVFVKILFFVALLVPVSTHATGLFSTDPIFPVECTCDDQTNPNGGPSITTAPDYGCVLQVVQNVINFVISIGILLTVFYIAWAGARMILHPGNSGELTKAKNQILNGVIGIVVILCSWLIVDFVMKYLYNPDVKYKENTFGPWNSILADDGNHKCIEARNPTSITTDVVGIVTEAPNNSGSVAETDTGSTTGGGSCSAIPASQLVTVDGYRVTANTAGRYSAMKAAAAKDGVTLVITSGYRSPDDQLSAWNNNGCSLVNGQAVCKTRTAAVPCSLGGGGSNHTRGTAVDIRLNSGVYAWLKQHAGQYGFYNNLPNDLPHWSDTGR